MSRYFRLFVALICTSVFLFSADVLAQTNFAFDWGEAWGGASHETDIQVATDSNGNVFIAGSFESSDVDFNPGLGTDIHSTHQYSDVFLTKYNSDGSYGWTKTWGGISNDYGQGLYVDSTGNIYVAGYFADTVDFNPDPVVEDLHSAGHFDSFLTKFDTNGNHLWARTWGGTKYDVASDVVADSSGRVTVAGWFQGTPDFDPGPGVDTRTVHGDSYDFDLFISRFDSNGNYYWVKTYGGTGYERGNALALDDFDNVYAIGDFRGNADFDPGAGTDFRQAVGLEDGFIMKLDPSGATVWLKTIGGQGYDHPEDVSIGADGSVYVTGWFEMTADFDPGGGEFSLTPTAERDAFLLSIDATGAFRWATHWGGEEYDYGTRGLGIATTENGAVIVGGSFDEVVDFDPTTNERIAISEGKSDGFVNAFTFDGEYLTSLFVGSGLLDDRIRALAAYGDNIFFVGTFQSSAIDLDPGPGSDTRTNIGSFDHFVTAMTPLYTLEGSVMSGGNPFAGVLVSESSSLRSTESDSSGVFAFDDIALGDDFTLTPTKYGYYFTPSSVSGKFAIGENVNFTALVDECPDDPLKVQTGTCGCGVEEVDSDADGSLDCVDSCPGDTTKTAPGVCGCGESDVDLNANGIVDCEVTKELKARLVSLEDAVVRLRRLKDGARKAKQKEQRALKREATALLAQIATYLEVSAAEIFVSDSTVNIQAVGKRLKVTVKKALKTGLKAFKKNKKKARKQISIFQGLLA